MSDRATDTPAAEPLERLARLGLSPEDVQDLLRPPPPVVRAVAAEPGDACRSADELARRAEACFRAGDTAGGAAALQALLDAGRPGRARELAAELRPLCRDAAGRSACDHALARADLALGLRLADQGRYDEALSVLLRAETALVRLGERKAAWAAFQARTRAVRCLASGERQPPDGSLRSGG